MKPNQAQKDAHRNAAIKWAAELVAHKDGFIIFDLETTGLPGKGKRVEICQIGIIDSDGEVLMSTLVKPGVLIEPGASKVTGITAETVKDAPSFSDIAVEILNVFCDRHIVIYNMAFDGPVLRGMFKSSPIINISVPSALSMTCAMLNYADFHGEWNSYRKSFKWQKLTAACAQMGIPVQGAHDATTDCLMTLALVKAMAEAVTVTQPALMDVEEAPVNQHNYDHTKSPKRRKR